MNKLCKKCTLEKPIGEFRDSKQTNDKKFPICRECQNLVNKLLYQKNKQKRIQQVVIWNNLHPNELKSYKKVWRKNKKKERISS